MMLSTVGVPPVVDAAAGYPTGPPPMTMSVFGVPPVEHRQADGNGRPDVTHDGTVSTGKQAAVPASESAGARAAWGNIMAKPDRQSSQGKKIKTMRTSA